MGQNNTLLEIRRLLDAQSCVHFSTATGSVTNVVQRFAVGSATVTSDRFIGDNWVRLTSLEFVLSDIAGGATTLTWYLARDSTGLHPITPVVTTTWHVVSGTDAVAAALIDVPYRYIQVTSSTKGQVYLSAVTNVGSVSVVAYLNWLSNSNVPALTASDVGGVT